MAERRLLRTAFLTAVTLAICAGYAVACDREIIKKTSVGKNLTLSCDGVFCPTYRWYNATAAPALPLSEETMKLTVSPNVTRVEEVGGQRYTCRCNSDSEDGDCLSFWIWVTPQVNLSISPPVVKLNSSVSIMCIAESYPPANDTSFFHLSSPHGQSLSSDQSASVGNGVEYHIARVNRSHEGEYDCLVTIEGYSQELQSNTVKRNLTVYDPPRIVGIRNFTLYSEPHGVESALLECEVENKEDGLEVWVNWTTGKEAAVGHKGCVSEAEEYMIACLLVLHNVTKKDVRRYTCQVFSAYSPHKAEDQKTAEILIAGANTSTVTPGRPTSEGVTPDPKEEHCVTMAAIVGVVAAIISVAATIFFSFICIGFYKTKKRSHAGHSELISLPPVHQDSGDDFARYVDIDRASASQRPTQESVPHNADQQTSQPGDCTATNSVTTCSSSNDSSQEVPPSPTPTQEHASVSFDGQTSESENLTRTNSTESKHMDSAKHITSGGSTEADDIDTTNLEDELHPLPQRSKSLYLSFTKGSRAPEMERLLSSPLP